MTHLTTAHPTAALTEHIAVSPRFAVRPAGDGAKRGVTKAQRVLIVRGATLVAVVAMAASATTLADLGRAVGWGQILAWSLPVSVDVLALVAGLAWLAGGAGQGLGRALTLITVAVSVTLNAIGHLVSTKHLETNSTLVIGVSAVPPLAAALAIHLGATVNADRTETPAPRPASTTVEADPEPVVRYAAADQTSVQDHLRATDQPTEPAPRDHDAKVPDQRTNRVPARADQAVDQDEHDSPGGPSARDQATRNTGHPTEPAPADRDTEAPDQRATPVPDHADQDAAPNPQEAAHKPPTRKSAGQMATDAPGSTDHVRADRPAGPADEPNATGPDQQAPADQMRAQDHAQVAGQSTRTTSHPADPAPAGHGIDAPDQRTNPAPDQADQPADQDEDDSAGGPHGARTTSHDEPSSTARTEAADQDDEVPWEVKVEIARQAALTEGRMTRRVIRPHLRNHGITVSNALFSDLQSRLYEDPTLAHLPRPPRRTR
ncbi:DUF2637 domain-containing protein [Streptomyces noursei]|uniref:DUF2637 domain-containing protein n=1 Tax=Streptomyces noursei TaxID=1971 RepID=UPI003641B8FD